MEKDKNPEKNFNESYESYDSNEIEENQIDEKEKERDNNNKEEASETNIMDTIPDEPIKKPIIRPKRILPSFQRNLSQSLSSLNQSLFNFNNDQIEPKDINSKRNNFTNFKNKKNLNKNNTKNIHDISYQESIDEYLNFKKSKTNNNNNENNDKKYNLNESEIESESENQIEFNKNIKNKAFDSPEFPNRGKRFKNNEINDDNDYNDYNEINDIEINFKNNKNNKEPEDLDLKRYKNIFFDGVPNTNISDLNFDFQKDNKQKDKGKKFNKMLENFQSPKRKEIPIRKSLTEVQETKFDIEEEKTKLKEARAEKIADVNNLYKKRQLQNYLIIDVLAILQIIVFCFLVIIEVNAMYGYRLTWTINKILDIDRGLDPYDYNDYTLYSYKIIHNLIDDLENGYLFEDGKFKIATNIRLTKRVNKMNKKVNNYINVDPDFYERRKSVKTTYINPYAGFHGEEIESRERHGNYNYSIDDSFKKLGGYVRLINQTTLTGQTLNIKKNNGTLVKLYNKEVEEVKNNPKLMKEKREKLLEEMKEFITKDVSVVIIDFTIINLEVGYFILVIIEIYNGNLSSSLKQKIFPINASYITASETYHFSVFLVFFILTGMRVVHLIYYNIFYAYLITAAKAKKTEMKFNDTINRSRISSVKFAIDNTEIKTRNKTFAFDYKTRKLKLPKSRRKCNPLEFTKILISLFFPSVLGVLDLIVLFLSTIICFNLLQISYFIWICRKYIITSNEYFNVVLDHKFSVEILNFYYAYYNVTIFMGLCALFFFFKIVNNVKNFSDTLDTILTGLLIASSDILSFFLIFFIVICSIAFAFYLYYSQIILNFNTYLGTLKNILYYFIGDSNGIVTKMYNINPGLTVLFMILMYFFVKRGMRRILLASIMYHFDYLKKSKKNKYKQTTMENFKEKIDNDNLNQVKNFFLNFFRKKKNVEKNRKKRTPSEELQYQKDHFQKHVEIVNSETHLKFDTDLRKSTKEMNIYRRNKEVNYFAFVKGDIEKKLLSYTDLKFVYLKFDENYEMIERDPYFDSQQDISKINTYYTLLFQSNFRRNLFYFIMLIFGTMAIITNNLAVWHYDFKSLIDNRIKHEELQYNINQINRVEEIDRFYLNVLPGLFDYNEEKEENFLGFSNHLIGEIIFLTKLRQDKATNSDYEDNLRKFEAMPGLGSLIFYENITSINFPENKIIKELKYEEDKDKAFGGMGGLVAELNVIEWQKTVKNLKDNFLNDKLHDPFDTYIIAEMILENISIDIMVKYTFTTQVLFGGKIKSYYYIDIVQKNFTSNYLAIMKFIFVILSLISTIVVLVYFIIDVRKLSNIYDKWYLKNLMHVSIQAKEARNFLNSEFVRKLYIICNPPRVLMVFVLIAGIAVNIMIIVNSVRIFHFYKNLVDYSELKRGESDKILEKAILYKIKNQMHYISIYGWETSLVGSCFIFFGYLRIMYSFNVGIYFYTFSQIFIKTLRKNFMIILLIFIILPAFIIFAYAVFGFFIPEFNTFQQSSIINFLRIFSFENLKDADESMYVTLYELAYGILINLLIVNLFVSIINTSYLRIKSKIFYATESFNWYKIICFCCNKVKKNHSLEGKENIITDIDNYLKRTGFDKMFENREFKNVQEFCDRELEVFKEIQHILDQLENSSNLMILAYRNRNKGENILSLNRYRGIDMEVLDLQAYLILYQKMDLNSYLEEEYLEIIELIYKYKIFYISRKDRKFLGYERYYFDKLIDEIKDCEMKIKVIISDIEKLREIKNKFDIIEMNMMNTSKFSRIEELSD